MQFKRSIDPLMELLMSPFEIRQFAYDLHDYDPFAWPSNYFVEYQEAIQKYYVVSFPMENLYQKP